MAKATMIMPPSNRVLLIMFMPNRGRLLRNNGNTAQWIAHATEAVMPRVSQLIRFIRGKDSGMQLCCKK